MRKAKLLSSCAIALAMSLGFAAAPAIAQTQTDKAAQDAKKKADDQKLSPVKPIRNVGPDDPSKAKSDQNAQSNSSAQQPKETTGSGSNAASSQPATPQNQTQQTQPNQTTGQAQPNSAAQKNAQQPANTTGATQNNTTQSTAQQPANAQQNTTAQQPSAQAQQNTAAQPSTATQSNANLGVNAQGQVALNTTQQRQLSVAIQSARVTPVTSINFALRTGTVVPADVRLVPVTTEIVTILPQFRGYSFFTTREQIVIVEPTSKQIVALVPVQASAAAVEPRRQSTTKRSTTTTRQSTSRRAPTVIERDVTVGSSAPDTVVIERAAPVYREETTIMPAVPGYGSRIERELVPAGREVIIERR